MARYQTAQRPVAQSGRLPVQKTQSAAAGTSRLSRLAVRSIPVAQLLDLQRKADAGAGCSRDSAPVQRAYTGYRPAIIYDNWQEDVGTGEKGIAFSLTNLVFNSTNFSDDGVTLEDEIEAAIDLMPEYLRDETDTNKLLTWQKTLTRAFGRFNASFAASDWDNAIQYIDEAVQFLGLVNGLPQEKPAFDVTWKKRVPEDGSIVMRPTGSRMEALFSVEVSGRLVKKNLNVSLRRHWWSGLTAASVANAAGNSIMSPRLAMDAIKDDVESVAKQYRSYVAKNGVTGEFAATTPSGQKYWVNHLDRQQPHTFPTTGSQTTKVSAVEYTAAVRLKVHSDAVARNHNSPVSASMVRQALQAAPAVLTKLQGIGVGFDPNYLKQVKP